MFCLISFILSHMLDYVDLEKVMYSNNENRLLGVTSIIMNSPLWSETVEILRQYQIICNPLMES